MKNILTLIASILIFSTISMAQTDITKIDFTNFSYIGIEPNPVKMKDGLQADGCESKSEDGIPSGDIWSLQKENIVYGDLNGDGKAEAIIPMVANICDGLMITNEAVLVFTMSKGKAVQLPTFDYYDEGCKAGEKDCNFARNPGVTVQYDEEEKAIIIETSFSTGDDAICCPSLFRETWFKWNGSAFTEAKKGEITKREKTEGN